MPDPSSDELRRRLRELVDNPDTRMFVFGYLLSCLDERYWLQLIQSALEHAEEVTELLERSQAAAKALSAERFR